MHLYFRQKLTIGTESDPEQPEEDICKLLSEVLVFKNVPQKILKVFLSYYIHNYVKIRLSVHAKVVSL